ncbi:glycosyltransferase family 8 protein [Micromonospora sp. NPDC018662]|uniref:glycosyltransferase family 8 protein n=1 Tax=Micromonospora sp. NPDC018662 TaxID=3364238 RepID=UPI0037BBE6D2
MAFPDGPDDPHAKHPQPIHIAFCVDDNYVNPMLVTARSVRGTMAPTGRPLVFHLLDGGLSPEGRDAALDGLGRVGDARFHQVADGLRIPDWHAADNPNYNWWTSASLRRLHLAEVVPESVERVLYLDADTLAVEDVTALHDTDLQGRCLAAVGVDRPPGYWPEALAAAGDRRTHTRYFNSGVLVLDLHRWREQRVGPRAAALYQAHERVLRHPDQDTLNILLDDQWVGVDPRWNRLVQYHRGDPFGLERMAALDTDEGILHFGGRVKPWHDSYPDTPLRRRYRAYQ